MKVLVQRVTRAAVRVDGATVGAIGRGLLLFVGVERKDDAELAAWYARRALAMRLFADGDTPWAASLVEAGAEVLLVSQFTLAARTRKGRRPSFDPAAPAEQAVPLLAVFRDVLVAAGVRVAEGRFGALMEVELVNDGPVTFLLDGPAVGAVTTDAADGAAGPGTGGRA